MPYIVPWSAQWQHMLPPEPASNAAAHSELPELPSTESQFPPPELTHSASLAADMQAVDASGGVGSPCGGQYHCDYNTCGQIFRKRQQLTRHLNQVHSNPVQMCPFEPCPYTWKRPDKIKAHINNARGSEFCPKVLEQIHKLKGKRMIEFLGAHAFDICESCDTYIHTSTSGTVWRRIRDMLPKVCVFSRTSNSLINSTHKRLVLVWRRENMR